MASAMGFFIVPGLLYRDEKRTINNCLVRPVKTILIFSEDHQVLAVLVFGDQFKFPAFVCRQRR